MSTSFAEFLHIFFASAGPEKRRKHKCFAGMRKTQHKRNKSAATGSLRQRFAAFLSLNIYDGGFDIDKPCRC